MLTLNGDCQIIICHRDTKPARNCNYNRRKFSLITLLLIIITQAALNDSIRSLKCIKWLLHISIYNLKCCKTFERLFQIWSGQLISVAGEHGWPTESDQGRERAASQNVGSLRVQDSSVASTTQQTPSGFRTEFHFPLLPTHTHTHAKTAIGRSSSY